MDSKSSAAPRGGLIGFEIDVDKLPASVSSAAGLANSNASLLIYDRQQSQVENPSWRDAAPPIAQPRVGFSPGISARQSAAAGQKGWLSPRVSGLCRGMPLAGNVCSDNPCAHQTRSGGSGFPTRAFAISHQLSRDISPSLPAIPGIPLVSQPEPEGTHGWYEARTPPPICPLPPPRSPIRSPIRAPDHICERKGENP